MLLLRHVFTTSTTKTILEEDLVDVDDVADVLVLVLGGVDRL